MVNPPEDPSRRVRVLLVDDEALMRAGLRLMIDGSHGIEVVGEAADGQDALQEIRELAPDVVLMDIRMPRMTGLEALSALREQGCEARVVMLTAFDTDEFLLQALRAGAMSFLLKDSPPQEVVQAVLDAADDHPASPPTSSPAWCGSPPATAPPWNTTPPTSPRRTHPPPRGSPSANGRSGDWSLRVSRTRRSAKRCSCPSRR
ncbi:response regulator [Brachybacterium alimentarium]|uniref:response regulator n=1 Tax=Brachybacterium alimentarium TaxID=47845 RepID=UPI002163BAA0|nr:response regulator transcription factor [Brachybacterium alimentarium]